MWHDTLSSRCVFMSNSCQEVLANALAFHSFHALGPGRTVLYAFPKVYMTSGPLSASSTRKNTERALCA